MVKRKNDRDACNKAKKRMREYRERIKNDPERYELMKQMERERYKKRVESGKIKTAKSKMSERERRCLRKSWKEKTSKYRESVKNKTNVVQALIAPPENPVPCGSNNDNVQNESRRKISDRNKRRKNRKELKDRIMKLEEKLELMTRKVAKYRQRLHRSQCANSSDKKVTPRKKVKNVLKGQSVTPVVRKKLLFAEVMTDQIKESYEKEKKFAKRHDFVDKLNGDIIKKYRCVNKMKLLTSARIIHKYRFIQGHEKKIFKKKFAVKSFLEQGENSTVDPGKKETITFKKEKKQKRYLNNTLLELHKKFNALQPDMRMSYALFCKFRPFWIVTPNIKNRDSCLSVIHENFSLLIKKLKVLKIIKENSPQEILASLCCQVQESCLERRCPKCKQKEIIFNGYFENDCTSFEKWILKKVTIVVKGTAKSVNRTLKEKKVCYKKDLVTEFHRSVGKFMQHCANIQHQYKIIKNIKSSLGLKDILIHIDFSENYLCKYSNEIQSVHFGSSKQQLSLHTVIAYIKCPEKENFEKLTYCTVSENLRHDPPAICAHLLPVLKEIKTILPEIETAHFLSDGPTTQYRNIKMFHLICDYLTEVLSPNTLYWHYSEAGHGKGAPDGVGGFVKRTADRIIAMGTDIPDFESFVTLLEKQCSSVNIIPVEHNDINTINKHLPASLRSFKGTMKCHQVSWSKKSPLQMQIRSLSCLDCLPERQCNHYDLGCLKIKTNNLKDTSGRLHYIDVYSDSDNNDISEGTGNEETDGYDQEKSLFKSIKENDYVVVKFCTKKTVKHYVGKVEFCDRGFEYLVKFLRNVSENKFVFPESEDRSLVNCDDIVSVLPPPSNSKRGGQYIFSIDLLKYTNLG